MLMRVGYGVAAAVNVVAVAVSLLRGSFDIFSAMSVALAISCGFYALTVDS